MKHFENAKLCSRLFVRKKCNYLICWICTHKEEGFDPSSTLALWLWKHVLGFVAERAVHIHIHICRWNWEQRCKDQRLTSLMWAKTAWECNMFLYKLKLFSSDWKITRDVDRSLPLSDVSKILSINCCFQNDRMLLNF